MGKRGEALRPAQPLSAPAGETFPAAPPAEAACDPLPKGTLKGEGNQSNGGLEFPGHRYHSRPAWSEEQVSTETMQV